MQSSGLVIFVATALCAARLDAQCPDGTVPPCRVRRAAPEKSVAVLPFRNIGADPTQQYFSDGIADAILNALQRLPDVKVSARSSSFIFRDRDIDVRTVGESLGVAKIVDGSVLQAGERVRIVASLSDARSRQTIWSQNFDRTRSEIFELLDDVSRAIANRVAGLDSLGQTRLISRGTSVPAAHDRYLRGRELLALRTPAGVRASVREFEEAIRLDRRYAAAYAALGSAYGLAGTLVVYSRPGPADSNYAWAGRALAASNRAIQLDSTNAEAFAARGYLQIYTNPAADKAEADLLRAIRLKPSYAEAHGWYAQHLAMQGRHAEGLVAVDRAIELDPLSLGMRLARVSTNLLGGAPAPALEDTRAIHALYPAVRWLRLAEGWALVLLGRNDECLRTQELGGIIAMCLHSAGRAAEAAQRIDSIISTLGGEPEEYALANITAYFAWTAQREQARKWLQRSLERAPIHPLSVIGMREPLRRRYGEAFEQELARLQHDAWARVVLESQRAVFR